MRASKNAIPAGCANEGIATAAGSLGRRKTVRSEDQRDHYFRAGSDHKSGPAQSRANHAYLPSSLIV